MPLCLVWSIKSLAASGGGLDEARPTPRGSVRLAEVRLAEVSLGEMVRWVDGMPRPFLLLGNPDDRKQALYFRVQAGYGFSAMLGFLQGKISERNGAIQTSGGP